MACRGCGKNRMGYASSPGAQRVAAKSFRIPPKASTTPPVQTPIVQPQPIGQVVEKPPCDEKDPSTGFSISVIKNGHSEHGNLSSTEPNEGKTDMPKSVEESY